MSEISIEFNDFVQFGEYTKELSRLITDQGLINAVVNSGILQDLKAFVEEEIGNSLINTRTGDSHSFGLFMAKRTVVNAVPTDNGINIIISGISEKEVAKVSPGDERRTGNNEDLNLWALYESGQIGNSGKVNTSKQAIKKDDGGVLAIRTGGYSVPMQGQRKGLIRSVVSRIAKEIEFKVVRAVGSYAKAYYALAEAEAAKRAGRKKTGKVSKVRNKSINRLPNQKRQEAARALSEVEVELAALGIKPVFYQRNGKSMVNFVSMQTGKISTVDTAIRQTVYRSLRKK